MTRASTKGQLTTRFATLAEHFHLTIPEIAELTPRQVDDIYFHARDKHGALKERIVHEDAGAKPAAEQTYEEAQMSLDMFYFNSAQHLRLTPDDYARLKRELAVKYGKEEKAG